MLAERSAEATRVETDLAAFKIRYRHEVGLLHEELDELELKISELELGEIAKRLENEGRDSKRALERRRQIPAPATRQIRSGSSFATSRRSSIPISRATTTPATAVIR